MLNPTKHYPSRRPRSSQWTAAVSALACLVHALPNPAAAQETVVAYAVPADTAGNQAFGGPLGMDFDVDNPIVVTRLGVFDDGSNGLSLPLMARLYDRATMTEMASLEFTPEEAGVLMGGSRFKALTTSLNLPAGFQGTIVAEGYGAEEKLRNSNGKATDVTWTLHDGNGSIRFVGLSRWGDVAGVFPEGVDGGPAARYAAATFEYTTTPALLPGKPVVSLKPGDASIVLSWPPVTQPLAAAKYEVQRANVPSGPFSKIADVTTTNYTDSPLVNGSVYSYTVRAVGANGKPGSDSEVRSAAPYAPLATNEVISYLSPAGKAGSSSFNGSLGVDFDVQNPIHVTRLAVFDDNCNGLKGTLTARIYNRTNQEVLATLEFTPEDPGVLIEGLRFKPLPQPLELGIGFAGVAQADGFSEDDRYASSDGDTNRVFWTLHDGNGSLKFVGTSRYGMTAGAFPDIADGGPAARFMAASFLYQTTPPQKPGTPTLRAQLPPEDAAVSLVWDPVLIPLPAATYRVQRGTALEGPFAQVAEVPATHYRDTSVANGVTVYYRLVAVAASGQTSLESAVVSITPNPRRGGIAYLNPSGLAGNQAFGGSLGMDFDVAHALKVTRLGVFDDGSDGLNLAITVALYDRKNQSKLAGFEFSANNPGELVAGSRFLDLTTPLTLPAGFEGCIVASGYGVGEQLFNTHGLPANIEQLSTFDGGSLVFVGSGRWGDPATYPATADDGPANRYAAGTFAFEPATEVQPAQLTITLVADKVRIEWSGGGSLYRSPEVTGPWSVVSGAVSGVELTPQGSREFYRVQQ